MHTPFSVISVLTIVVLVFLSIQFSCQNRVQENEKQAQTAYLKGKEFAEKYTYNLDQEDWNSAKKQFIAAIELNPKLSDAWLALGWAYFDSFYWWSEEFLKKDYLDSVLVLSNKTLDLNHDLAGAYHLRGRYYSHSGQIEKALIEFNKALALNPEDVSILLSLGWYYCQFKEDYSEGFKFYKKAIDFGTEEWPPRYHNDLAYGYMNIADYDNAIHHLHQAIRFQPGVMEPILLSSWLLEVQGKLEEKMVFLDSIQKAFPGSNAVISELAYTYAGTGNFEDAEKHYAQVIDTLDNEERIPLKFAHRLGYVFWNLGQEERAMEYFKSQLRYCEESLATGEGYQTAEYDLAAVHAFLGHIDLALEYLEAYAEKGFTYGLQDYISHDPLFKNLWDNEKFKTIIQEAQDEKTDIRTTIGL